MNQSSQELSEILQKSKDEIHIEETNKLPPLTLAENFSLKTDVTILKEVFFFFIKI